MPNYQIKKRWTVSAAVTTELNRKRKASRSQCTCSCSPVRMELNQFNETYMLGRWQLPVARCSPPAGLLFEGSSWHRFTSFDFSSDKNGNTTISFVCYLYQVHRLHQNLLNWSQVVQHLLVACLVPVTSIHILWQQHMCWFISCVMYH